MIRADETVNSRLEREVRRVNRLIETLRRGGHSEELESGGDNTPLSDMADATQIVEEREIATQLLTWLTDRSVELDRALHRIEVGTYGICARCERPIHPERLQALPDAPLCQECQRRAEAEHASRRPQTSWSGSNPRAATGSTPRSIDFRRRRPLAGTPSA